MSWHVCSLSPSTVFTFQMLSQLITILAVSSHVALVNDCCHLFLASGCLFFLELQAIHEHLALLEALKLETLPGHGVELAKIMEFILVKTHYSKFFDLSISPNAFHNLRISVTTWNIRAEFDPRVQVEQQLIIAKNTVSHH